MNLPKGPDTLCFDKDEFAKVRAGAALSEPGLRSRSRGCALGAEAGGLPSFPSGASSGCSCWVLGRAHPGSAPGGTSLPSQ